jgi:hypothetical protein
MIVGKCPHGIVVAAAIEELTSHDELETMAAAYKLERVDMAALDGLCPICTALSACRSK